MDKKIDLHLVWTEEEYRSPDYRYNSYKYVFHVNGKRSAVVLGPSQAIPWYRTPNGRKAYETLDEAKVDAIAKWGKLTNDMIIDLQSDLASVAGYRVNCPTEEGKC